VRRQTGYDLDLDGFDTDHITLGAEVLYHNPYQGRRWNDGETTIASLLEAMAAWVRGDRPPPYPLTEGAQDHWVAPAVEVAAESGETVVTTPQAWA